MLRFIFILIKKTYYWNSSDQIFWLWKQFKMENDSNIENSMLVFGMKYNHNYIFVIVPKQVLDFQVIYRGFFFGFLINIYFFYNVLWFEVRNSCSFCWYCWNCWSWMLKLTFHMFFLSIFRITKLHNLLKQQQEMMRQMADHLHVDIKLDNLSLAESLRSEMASRIGLWFILKLYLEWKSNTSLY